MMISVKKAQSLENITVSIDKKGPRSFYSFKLVKTKFEALNMDGQRRLPLLGQWPHQHQHQHQQQTLLK